MKKLRMVERQRMKKEAFLSKIILARTPLPYFQVLFIRNRPGYQADEQIQYGVFC